MYLSRAHDKSALFSSKRIFVTVFLPSLHFRSHLYHHLITTKLALSLCGWLCSLRRLRLVQLYGHWLLMYAQTFIGGSMGIRHEVYASVPIHRQFLQAAEFFKKICPILQILHRCIRPAVLHLQHASHDAPAMRGEVAAMSEPPRRNGWLG